MISRHVTELGLKRLLLVPNQLFEQNMFVLSLSKYTTPCQPIKRCQSKRNKGRRERSDPVRLGFIPEEWFQFFYVKTGVTGPYIFGLVTINYLLSKEIYVLEHEYYSGLSIALLVYLATVKLGPAGGAALDKEVDAVVAGWQKTLDDEKSVFQNQIKASKDAQWRADGQKLLMDAKKENIAMQYEAIFRERMMQVYKSTEGRMIYHTKKYRAEARIHQKWMLKWILNNVMKSITPDFKKAALEASIRDLAAATPTK